MKKLWMEIVIAIVFVVGATNVVYTSLADSSAFWDEQRVWSTALIICWSVVAGGYFHQGWIVRNSEGAREVSVVLPIAVFIVQCILFVKGIYYDDVSLIIGAVLVNSGVTYSLYHIIRAKHKTKNLP